MLSTFFCTLAALAQSAETPVVVLADTTLRLACLAGALLGALITLGLSKEGDSLRALTLKALTAVVAGVSFTPLLLRYFAYTPDVDVVLGASAALGSVSTATLQAIMARYDKWLNHKLDKYEE